MSALEEIFEFGELRIDRAVDATKRAIGKSSDLFEQAALKRKLKTLEKRKYELNRTGKDRAIKSQLRRFWKNNPPDKTPDWGYPTDHA
jgi:hypothetical protein